LPDLGQNDQLVLAVLRQLLHQLGGAVRAVVDEDDLHRDRGQRGLEPLDEGGYVVSLVLRRDDDREQRSRPVVERLRRPSPGIGRGSAGLHSPTSFNDLAPPPHRAKW
jgi:hypothetical protein